MNTERYSVFSPNAGKNGPEKTPYLDAFHLVPALDKFTKISKIGYYVECFITGFSCFSNTAVKFCLLGAWLDPHLQLQAFWRFS